MRSLRTVREISKAYSSGSASPVELVASCLERAERENKRLNCFITLLEESSTKAAEEAELRRRQGKRVGPLDGVPIAVKDIVYIEGVRCTAGSKILANNVAPYDAPVVKKLKASGAVIIGTTNLHEFAAGITNENPHFGPVHNPWDLERISGGSSGGSAAAVAAECVPAAIGTDTAGSVRVPAALCGVLGFKPTYGRVSRLGVIPLASSFDTVGTLTSSAWDAAALLQVMAGHDPEDMTTVAAEVPDYLAGLGSPLGRTRVGVPRKYFHDSVDSAIEEKFNAFLDCLRELGCEVESADLDGAEEAYQKWLPIRQAEATAFHLRWLDSHPEMYGEDVRRFLEQGRQVSAIDYVGAQNARPLLMERFLTDMKDYDLVATPATAALAPLIGHDSTLVNGKEVKVRSALIRLTIPFNVVGFPAVSVPAGTASGLPVGVQLAARPFDESLLLKVIDAYETRFGPFPSPGQA